MLADKHISLVEVRRIVDIDFAGSKGVKFRYHKPELFVNIRDAANYIDMHINRFTARLEEMIRENGTEYNVKGFIVNNEDVKFEVIIYPSESLRTHGDTRLTA